MAFDPVWHKKSLLMDEKEDIRRHTELYPPDQCPPLYWSASTADAPIQAMLVGLYDEYADFVKRMIGCQGFRIAEAEREGEGSYLIHLVAVARAIYRWMDEGKIVAESWEVARYYHAKSLAEQKVAYSASQLRTEYLDDQMAYSYLAGKYAEGIAEFEHYCGAKAPSLTKTLRPRELAYAMCLHKARGQFTPEELFAAGCKMLKSYLNVEWFDRGQWQCGTFWLMVVYGAADPSLTPTEIVLKTYDYVPWQRPEGV